VDQTEDGYSVTINESSSLDFLDSRNRDLDLPKHPEFVINEQKKQNNRESMNPIITKKPDLTEDLNSRAGIDKTIIQPPVDSDKTTNSGFIIRKASSLIITIKDFVFTKGNAILKAMRKAPLKLTKFAKSLPIIGLFAAVIDAAIDIYENGWNTKSIIKGVFGVGLALVGVAAFFLSAPIIGAVVGVVAIGFAIWDLSGGLDKTIDNLIEPQKGNKFAL